MMKTFGNKGAKRCKWYGMGKQALFPVQQVITDNGSDITFVNAGAAFHDSRKIMAVLRPAGDLGLVWGRDLGIRDDERRQEGMRFFTCCAEYTHDAHADRTGRSLEGAVVISMYAETSGLVAGACDLMKRKVCDNRVINFTYFFRHRVEIREKKSYHSLAWPASAAECVGRDQTFNGWGSCFFICYQNMITYYVKKII